jgi:hypothetical protein
MGKVTFWVGLAASFLVMASALVTAGVWATTVQTDITSLRVKIGDNEMKLEKYRAETSIALEKLRQDGTQVSQGNTSNLKVLDVKYEYIIKALEQNIKDHERIMAELSTISKIINKGKQ